jgi:hypothetical protein
MWRDLRVLEALEAMLRAAQRDARCSSRSAPKFPRAAATTSAGWSRSYTWPVVHREGLPDLSNGEAATTRACRSSTRSRATSRVVFINQFGFERTLCGNRMPADMEFMDIRKGSDVEFGQSIYEPFGIAQVEPISFGGICVFSECCGCAGFVNKATGGQAHAERDRRRLHRSARTRTLRAEQLLRIGQPQRDEIEHTVADDGRQRAAGPPAARRRRSSSSTSTAATSGRANELERRRARLRVPGIQRATRAQRLKQIA